MRIWGRVARGTAWTDKDKRQHVQWRILSGMWSLHRRAGHPDFAPPDGWEEWEILDAVFFVLGEKSLSIDERFARLDRIAVLRSRGIEVDEYED